MEKVIASRTIQDHNAPIRLQGREVKVVIDEEVRRLDFEIDMPNDATKQEIGYFHWIVGECMEKFQRDTPGVEFGEPEYKQEIAS